MNIKIDGDVSDLFIVKAYGVKPCDTGFLHYWIDQDLQYHEETKPTRDTPRLGFWSGGPDVDLRGPSDYTVRYR